MRTVLMIYDQFPPYNLSGSQRPFQFAKHLPQFGYRPHVIATPPLPGEPVDHSLLEQLDPCCTVEQRPRLVARLAPYYRRMGALARGDVRGALVPAADASSPESSPPAGSSSGAGQASDDAAYRWLSWFIWFHGDWLLPAVDAAVRASRKQNFVAVWASAPNARNLLAGYVASLVLRKPLVLDLRDPWTYGSLWDPLSPSAGAIETFWARRILAHAARTVFTSPLTEREMRARFPGTAAERMCTITNGYVDDAPAGEPLRGAATDKLVMSYVGSLNDRRRPDVLLRALKAAGEDPVFARDVRLQFVGGLAGRTQLVSDLGLNDQVIDIGRVSHQESVRYMLGADVNVLLQTITSGQDVIAGKTFEYLAAQKPILAVVARDGGDAWLLEQAGAGQVVDFRDEQAVASAFRALHDRFQAGQLQSSVDAEQLARFSRRALTGELASIFDAVARD